MALLVSLGAHIGPGSMEVTDDFHIVYVAREPFTEDTAIYEICDTDGLCSSGYIFGWNGPRTRASAFP